MTDGNVMYIMSQARHESAVQESLVAQWLRYLTGVGKVIGSFPDGVSNCVFVPRS